MNDHDTTSTNLQGLLTEQQLADRWNTTPRHVRRLRVEGGLLASLLWRLDHGQVTLDPGTVVVLDEAGMTDDPDLLRLLTAAECAGAKVVIVGDDRQLSAVGLGGSLGALVARHEAGVWVLDENVRQADPGEREALEDLRAGDPALAIEWMAANGRIATRPDRAGAVAAMVEAWGADVDAGQESVMLAWRRTNVEALNRAARHLYEQRGLLTGPEVKAPGGRCYRAGDRVVTLAPGGHGEIVTSERGTVTAVNPGDGSLQARMDDGRLQAFSAEETGKDRLAHGYAITVHRSQGAAVDTAHRLEDGGGRELAYVATSRARHHTTVWVEADDLDQAIEDLNRDWPREHRQRWAIDAGTPASAPAEVEADLDADPTVRNALRRARLQAERDAVASAIPSDPTNELHRTRTEIASLRQALTDLPTGAGRWQGTEVGDVARQVADAQRARQEAVWRSNNPVASRSEVRAAKRDMKHADATIDQTRRRLDQLAGPERDRINDSINDLEHDRAALEAQARLRRQWVVDHPEVTRRLDHLDTELHVLDRALGVDCPLANDLTPLDDPRERGLAAELLESMPPASVVRRSASPPDLGLGL